MTAAPDRVLLNLADGHRRVVDPDEVYCLEAEGGETLVRLQDYRRMRTRPGSITGKLRANPRRAP